MNSPEANAVTVRLPPPKVETKRSAKAWAWGLGMALAGAGLGYVGAKSAAIWLMPMDGIAAKLGALVSLPVVWLVVVGWHELGHLVGGWMTGGKFIIWIVGPLKVWRTPQGIKVGRNKSLNLGGGLAACVPWDPAQMSARRSAVMILGGPIFSLILGVAGSWGLVGLFPAAANDGGVWALSYNVTAFTLILSLMIFGLTSAPFTAGGFKSDGKRAWDLLRGDKRSEQESALLLLTTAGLAGIRPADYDPRLVERVLSLQDGSMFDLYGRLTIYAHAADRGDWGLAQQLLDDVGQGESDLIPFMRDVYRCEYAWLLATQTTGVAAARAWLDSAGSLEVDPATRLRAEAAVLRAEGNFEEARTKVKDGLHALAHRSISPAPNLFAEEALRALF